MESILTSVKKLLGIDESYTQFDADLIMYINSAFAVLWQIGVGPTTCFSISDSTATWSEFTSDETTLNLVKTYVAKKVRSQWDPPTSSAVLEELNKSIAEDEWRISIMAPITEETT